MKKLSILLIALAFTLFNPVSAQQKKPFTGAEAKLEYYKALYALNSGDEKKINSTLRNVKNVLEDPRLKGKLEIELVVFGDGVKVYDKNGPYEERLKFLLSKGVILAQCENTLRERGINKDTLYPFISFVPSANGEMIIRHYQGWAVVHP